MQTIFTEEKILKQKSEIVLEMFTIKKIWVTLCINSIGLLKYQIPQSNATILIHTAGDAVDGFIKQLVPLLEPGDIIIDGGNSEYTDSTRRTKELAEKGILFVGSGVSGGEEGARYGPSLMPGGAVEAW